MKHSIKYIALALLVLAMAQLSFGGEKDDSGTKSNNILQSWSKQENMFGTLGGVRTSLEDAGISANLSLTHVYQHNLKGGLSTSKTKERNSGRYDLEMNFDLEKIINWSGATIFALARGGWNNGIDGYSIESFFGVNAVAVGNRSVDIWQLYFEQSFFNENTFFRIGKIDLTGEYDANEFANDEAAQFLNGSLVNNPTIPFPDPGIAAIIHLELAERLAISATIADANADVRETGFATAFHNPKDFFGILEASLKTQIKSSKGILNGTYRMGMWYDHKSKEYLNGEGKTNGDLGGYISWDQQIYKENNNSDDDQGMGVFARFGLIDQKVNELHTFWSVGIQYKGLIATRNNDIIGVGFSQGEFSNISPDPMSSEQIIEIYYNASITKWLNISPSIQYIKNFTDNKDHYSLVAGLRFSVNL